VSIQPRLKKWFGELQLPYNALVRHTLLLKEGLDLLLGVVPGHPLFVTALQVLQSSLTV
jgi:hypothetical protein